MEGTTVETIVDRHSPRARLNAICPYYTMFPLSFPLTVLADALPGENVLDPFCGRGTTLYAARLLGLSAVGIDSNPVAAASAASKLIDVTAGRVVGRCRQLLSNGFEPTEVPTGEFWERCYAPGTLRDICALREQLRSASATPINKMLRAIVLGVLHGPLRVNRPSYLSNQMPRTYASKPRSAVRFWVEKDLMPPTVDVLDVVSRRCAHTLADVPPAVGGEVRLGDAVQEMRRMRRRFSWVVTSPPYFGMRTYLPDQWLRSWFLGADPDVDYSIEGQLTQSSDGAFVDALAEVWETAAGRCELGARLVVRFGAVPSRSKTPIDLLRRSIEAAAAGWRIDEVRAAGTPPRGMRQADQMKSGVGEYGDEIDLYATLTAAQRAD